MTLRADLFPKLRTPQIVARYMSKKSGFKGPFARQHVKRVHTLLRSGTQLSQKQKAFSQFFIAFSKCTLNFEHFQKKDDPHS